MNNYGGKQNNTKKQLYKEIRFTLFLELLTSSIIRWFTFVLFS